jgi:hypothetical protein
MRVRDVRATVIAAAAQVADEGNASADILFQWACDHLIRNEIAARPAKGFIHLGPRAQRVLASGERLKIPPFVGNKRAPKGNWKKITREQNESRSTVNPAAALERLLSGITEKAPDRLLAVWKNAVAMLADPRRREWHSVAQRAIVMIDTEWSRRVASHDEKWFQWPTTDARGGSGRLSLDGAPEEGLLAFMGYRVGVTKGEPTPIRQGILDRIFLGTLPPIIDPAYTASWGPAGSAMRLKRIADSLASFAKAAKRRGWDSHMEAIREWEIDLSYLHDRYYVGRYRFAWPRTVLTSM